MKHLAYADHHDFSAADINKINSAFAALPSPRLLLTTEKDAARLNSMGGLSDEVRQATWQLPICVDIDDQEGFDKLITDYLNQENDPQSL